MYRSYTEVIVDNYIINHILDELSAEMTDLTEMCQLSASRDSDVNETISS